MKRFVALLLCLATKPIIGESVSIDSPTVAESIRLLRHINEAEKQLSKALRSGGGAILGDELVQECQQLLRAASLDELPLLCEATKDSARKTRAVCNPCNITTCLEILQNLANQLDPLITQIEQKLADAACTASCTLVYPTGITISTSGSYCLGGSTTTAGYTGSTAAITIDAENVTLDLNGHTIFMATEQDGIHIKKDYVTVKNGRIVRKSGTASNSNVRIAAADPTTTTLYNLTIEDMILTGNGTSASGDGLYMDNIGRVVVDNITADKNVRGIVVTGSTTVDTIIQNSRASANSSDGFYINAPAASTTGLVIQNCIAQGNGSDGFEIINTGGTQEITLKGNIAQSNTTYGFNASVDNIHIQFINNYSRGNGTSNYLNVNTKYSPLVDTLNGSSFWANIDLS